VLCENVGELLICDGCERSYHRQCLVPPLAVEQVPDGDWFCPPCQCSHSHEEEGNSHTTVTAAAAAGATTTQKRDHPSEEDSVQPSPKPKRPLPAYLLFAATLRAQAKAENGDIISNKVMSGLWKNVPDHERKKVKEEEKVLWEVYNRNLQEWKAKRTTKQNNNTVEQDEHDDGASSASASTSASKIKEVATTIVPGQAIRATATTPTTTPGSEGDVAMMMEQEMMMATKNIDGLVPMPTVRKSPYDGLHCAELEDAWFTEIKQTVLALSDPSTATSSTRTSSYAAAVQQRATLQNARLEIKQSGILFSVNWLEGLIRGKNFSTILSSPKVGDEESLLLVSLYEHRFSKGEDIVLKSIICNLQCFELVIKAMERWGYDADDYDYWKLLSHKQNTTKSNTKKENTTTKVFIFETQKRNCYKCQIFVARAYAMYQSLVKAKKEETGDDDNNDNDERRGRWWWW